METQAFSLSAAARHIRRTYGQRTHLSTVWRWMRNGVVAADGTRVRLEYQRVGRRMLTTPEAIEAFFRALTEADHRADEQAKAATLPARRRGRPASRREAAVAAAEAELAA